MSDLIAHGPDFENTISGIAFDTTSCHFMGPSDIHDHLAIVKFPFLSAICGYFSRYSLMNPGSCKDNFFFFFSDISCRDIVKWRLGVLIPNSIEFLINVTQNKYQMMLSS